MAEYFEKSEWHGHIWEATLAKENGLVPVDWDGGKPWKEDGARVADASCNITSENMLLSFDGGFIHII